MCSSLECKLKLESIKPWRVVIKSWIPLEKFACLVVFDYYGKERGTTSAVLIDFGPIFLLCCEQSLNSYPETKEEINNYKWYDYDTGKIAEVQEGVPTLTYNDYEKKAQNHEYCC